MSNPDPELTARLADTLAAHDVQTADLVVDGLLAHLADAGLLTVPPETARAILVRRHELRRTSQN